MWIVEEVDDIVASMVAPGIRTKPGYTRDHPAGPWVVVYPVGTVVRYDDHILYYYKHQPTPAHTDAEAVQRMILWESMRKCVSCSRCSNIAHTARTWCDIEDREVHWSQTCSFYSPQDWVIDYQRELYHHGEVIRDA